MVDMFSPLLKDILLNKKELVEKSIVTEMAFGIYESFYGSTEVFTFDKIAYIAVLEKFLNTGGIGIDDGKMILQSLEDDYIHFKDKGCEIVFLRKFGISTCFLVGIPNEFYFEKNVKFLEKVNLPDLIEELKIKIL
jgi:hypothetical protein